MGSSEMLIMDLDLNSCLVDHCGQIAKLLPDIEIVIQSGMNVPLETKPSLVPDLPLKAPVRFEGA